MDRMPQRVEEKLPAGDTLMMAGANLERIKESLEFFRVAALAETSRPREKRRQMVGARPYPFSHRHGETFLLGERIGCRQRLFQPSAQQIFAFSSRDLQPIGK